MIVRKANRFSPSTRAINICAAVLVLALVSHTRLVRAVQNGPELRAELEALDRRMSEIHDATARFTERKFTALLKKPLVSHGQVRVRGDRMRWDTYSPHPSTMLVEGNTISIYYPKRETLEVYRLSHKPGFVALSPLPRVRSLRAHFHIERLPADSGSKTYASATYLSLRLRPRSGFLLEHLRHIDVVVNRATAFAVRVETIDADGERTVIQFVDVKTNTGLSDADLSPVVPDGTKVVYPLARDGDEADDAERGESP